MSETGLERLTRAVAHFLDHTPPTATCEVASAGEAGSAGKTTTVVTYAALLAQLGFKVEIVDLDGQGNASKHLGIGTSPYPEDDKLLDPYGEHQPPLVMGDALVGRKAVFPGEAEGKARPVTLDDVRRCAYDESQVPGLGVISDDPDEIAWLKNIHVYPNGPSYLQGNREETTFYADEATLARDPLSGLVLGSKMDAVTTRPHFRFYDLHGTKSISMVSALIRVKKVFNCVTLDDKTTGVDLDHLKDTISDASVHNKDLQLGMILPCKVKSAVARGNHGREMLERLRKRHGELVPDVEVREAVTVTEAYLAREPLPLWVPNSPVTDDYRHALAWSFENGLFAT